MNGEILEYKYLNDDIKKCRFRNIIKNIYHTYFMNLLYTGK